MTTEDTAFNNALAATLARKPAGELSVQFINSTPDDELSERVFSSLHHAWVEDFGCNTDRLLASLPEGARALYLTSIAEGQVMNGGYAQLYKNGYGPLSGAMVQAFDYFSASRYAGMTREANKIYQKNRLLIWVFSGRTGHILLNLFQRDLLPSRLPELELLDSQFYAAEGELEALRIAKIRSSPESFVPHMPPTR